MFESLESRQLYSVATDAPDASVPTPVDSTVTVDASKTKPSSGGQIYLVFTFTLVAVKTVSWN
jgi:hypothetical protein